MTPRPRALVVIPFLLLSAHAALATDPDTPARASFPLVPADGGHPRESSLARINPQASAALPDVEQPSTERAPPPPTLAQSPAPVFSAAPASAPAPVSTRPPILDRKSDHDVSDDWMFSIEGVTHAPVDIGFQAGLELPIGLRLFGGYGVMPGFYRSLVMGAALSSVDAGTRTLAENVFDSGNAWRVALGIRPFQKLGLYFDAGYSRVTLSGSATADELTGLTGVSAASYSAKTSIDMWLLEVGYEAHVGDRLVVAVGAGAMGALKSSTTITSDGADAPTFQAEAAKADAALESYAVPTLTLRLGVDLI